MKIDCFSTAVVLPGLVTFSLLCFTLELYLMWAMQDMWWLCILWNHWKYWFSAVACSHQCWKLGKVQPFSARFLAQMCSQSRHFLVFKPCSAGEGNCCIMMKGIESWTSALKTWFSLLPHCFWRLLSLDLHHSFGHLPGNTITLVLWWVFNITPTFTLSSLRAEAVWLSKDLLFLKGKLNNDHIIRENHQMASAEQ